MAALVVSSQRNKFIVRGRKKQRLVVEPLFNTATSGKLRVLSITGALDAPVGAGSARDQGRHQRFAAEGRSYNYVHIHEILNNQKSLRFLIGPNHGQTAPAINALA